MKKMNLIKKIVATGTVAALSVAMLAGTAIAGAFVTNEKGIWFDNGDGTFPASVWKWIDADGDGQYQCFAFDENGYAYVNTTTPDGFTTDATGAWVQNGVQVARTALENIADNAIVSSAVKSLKNATAEEYLNAINAINGVTGETYGTTSKVTNMTVKKLTTTNAGDIATSKLTVTRKTASGSDADSGPDMSLTSYDTFGPSVPQGAITSAGAPLTDVSKVNVVGPDGMVSTGEDEK
ncbi:hypothetical protein UYO_1575 [Lachnospiraceae bacterium JC7]|nr:hypothetical protein UYO_1575 [Lachnospiraceae bacterium JC7]